MYKYRSNPIWQHCLQAAVAFSCRTCLQQNNILACQPGSKHVKIYDAWADLLNHATESCCSVLPNQLAARCHHRIPWSALTHIRAAAWGDLPLLRWLVAEPVTDDYRPVQEDCSNGRMFLLVHGLGWTLPSAMTQRLAATEQCRFALLGTVQQLRRYCCMAAAAPCQRTWSPG